VDAFWRWRLGAWRSPCSRGAGGVVAEGHRRPARPSRGGDGRDAAIGRRHDLVGLSFGHAGDGNLHSAFLVRPDDPDEIRRAALAVEDLFDVARAPSAARSRASTVWAS
jgi:FAD/FMN-containing dehydrogenase